MTEQANIRILPFKAKKHRHLMPFKKGQGISIAGWQFKIRSVQANGIMNLQCMGKILSDEPAAASITVPGQVEVLPTKNMAQIDTTRKALPVCTCEDQGHGLLNPTGCPVHDKPPTVENPCPKCGAEVPNKSHPHTQCPECQHIITEDYGAKNNKA